jgi:hypothetical protein
MIEPAANALDAVTSDRASAARDWFLRDSRWTDTCWVFAATSALEEERSVRIRWDFELPDGARFTSRAYAALLESARRLIAMIRACSLNTGLPQRATTARLYFIRLRMLLCWMSEEGFTRFADIDAADLLRYRRHIANRHGRNARHLMPATLELSVRVLVYLHRYRTELGDGLTIDPCPGQCAHALVGIAKARAGFLPYTPDIVAVPLIQGAVALLETSAIDILCARERYMAACERACSRGLDWDAYRPRVLSAVQARPIHTPTGPITLEVRSSPFGPGASEQ